MSRPRWVETPGGVAAALNRYDDEQRRGAARVSADRAAALYEELRLLSDPELRALAERRGLDVTGFPRQATIATLIEFLDEPEKGGV